MPDTTTPAAVPAIERSIELQASPERVWRALSEAGELAGWFSQRCEIDLRPGGDAWQAGIRRTYALRSAPERVWEAIATIAGLDGWFGPTVSLEIRAGSEGWFDWPEHGRFAIRIEAVEAPRYLAWSWTPHRDVRLADASEVLRTEWYVGAAEGGGTALELLETGFMGPDEYRDNSTGWDSDVLPALGRLLGESGA